MKRFENHGLAWSRAAVVALAFALPGMMLASAASAADISKTPPAKFKKVSTLVKLPDFIPGMGTLYVDPATLPVGPFLGYNHGGKLVNIIYMVPLKDLEAHKTFDDLGRAAKGMKIDHTAIEFAHILHPGNDSPQATRGAKAGVKPARALGARITVLFAGMPYASAVYGEAAVYHAGPAPRELKRFSVKVAKKAFTLALGLVPGIETHRVLPQADDLSVHPGKPAVTAFVR